MAESSIAVAVRIRPFSAKEAAQLAPQETYQPFLGDGSLTLGSSMRNAPAATSSAPLLRTRFLRSILSPVDDKVLIFDPPDTNPLSRLYSSGQNTFGHGVKKARDVRYAFDRVFDERCGQDVVFENTTRPLLDGILNGYNASVFAYGATGCGKTHTISGTPEDPGVIFLTMKELYQRIEASRDESDVHVRLSYLEIYNEAIRDLLSPNPTPPGQGLMLREDAAKKMSVVGITEHIPESPEQVLEMIQEGNLRRTMSPTEANAVSSRSHAVLQINVTQRPRTADTITETTSASLNIIDLAGSERASATKNNGTRMKEGANINKSLLALGNCINALCQTGGQRSKHVPYRNSKLTRLLKFSLGGNCKTVMIVCVSPSSAHYDETHNTLKYANQAKNIRTKVTRNMLNVDRHVAQYVQAIHELREEVAELKAKLADKSSTESSVEKKRKQDMLKEMQEVKTKMKESTQNVKRIVKDTAGAESRIAAAEARSSSLSRHIMQLNIQIQAHPAGSAADLEGERDLLQQVAAKEMAFIRDANLQASIRTLHNSLQMQRGLIVAAAHNTKFDSETAESVRLYGDCLMSELEALQSSVARDTMKSTFETDTDNMSVLFKLSMRNSFAIKEATQQIQRLADTLMDEDEGIDCPLKHLAMQLQTISSKNEAAFSQFAAAGISLQTFAGSSNAFSRVGLRMSQVSTSTRFPAPKGRISVAGSSNKALLPVRSPRRVSSRRTTAGARRSGLHLRNSIGRNLSNSGIAPVAAPAKTFRWADEAGEGRIDDHDRKSASPRQVRISMPRAVEKSCNTLNESVSNWSEKPKSLQETEPEAKMKAWQQAKVDSEDIHGGNEASISRMRREGGLFERNFLVKKQASNSKVMEIEADSGLSDGTRPPFSDLSNGTGDASSGDDLSLVSDYASTSIRSSPYRHRNSQLGPIRRKGRTSLGEVQNVKSSNGNTTIARLATGPPLFTASRSSRISNLGSSSTSGPPSTATLDRRMSALPGKSNPVAPTSQASMPLSNQSSGGAAWR